MTHPLTKWLDARGMTLSAFADQLGCDAATVHRYVTRKRTPRPRIMAEIARITGGDITANDFMPGDETSGTVKADRPAA